MNVPRSTLMIGLALALAVSTGCGGNGTLTSLASRETPGVDQQLIPADAGLGATVLRSSSGLPAGVRLTFSSVDDSADGGSPVAGYHIYKSDLAIADAARGDETLWVDFGTGPLVPQPALAGSIVSVDDLFAANVGETWHYRLSAVAADGDESALSTAASITITSFVITNLPLTTAGVGDPVIVEGRNFGEYDSDIDRVEVPGVVWEDSTGFVPALLDAEILSWSPEEIVIRVPLGTTRGLLQITIGGETVESTEEFTNSDPYIDTINRLEGSILDQVVITGANFGDAPDADNHLFFGGRAYDDESQYTGFSDNRLSFFPKNTRDFAEPASFHFIFDAGQSNSGNYLLLNEPPVPYLMSEPETGADPLRVTLYPARLDGGGEQEYSYDPEGALTAYRYDTNNDGEFDRELTAPDPVTLTLSPGGMYEVRLEVEDLDGATAEITFQIQVDGVPFADLSANPTSGQLPFTVMFDASGSVDNDGTIEDYEWDFDGDGVFNEDNGENSARGNPVPAFEYNTSGDFTAAVRVTDNDGFQDTSSVLISVNAPPVADLTVDVNVFTIPFGVNFDATGSTDADGTIEDYEWDFDGDGVFNEPGTYEESERGNPAPAYNFDVPGSFDVTVRVTDDFGSTDTDSVNILAIARTPFFENWEAGIAPGSNGSIWSLSGDSGSRGLDWINTTFNRQVNAGAGGSARFARFDSFEVDPADRWYYGNSVSRAMLAGPFPVFPGGAYQLRFFLNGFSEKLGSDYLRVSYSWDGVNWTDVQHGAEQVGDEWQYAADRLHNRVWGEHREVLQAQAGEFHIRVLFVSNANAENFDGPSIDQLALQYIDP